MERGNRAVDERELDALAAIYRRAIERRRAALERADREDATTASRETVRPAERGEDRTAG